MKTQAKCVFWAAVIAAFAGCMAASSEAAVTAANGQRVISGSSAVNVNPGFKHWTYQANTQGIQGASATNVGRYIMHHSLTLSSMLIPVGGIGLWHNNTGTDTIAIRFYNAGNADSVQIISAAITDWHLPLYADSVAIKPFKASAAGDWSIVTYFRR